MDVTQIMARGDMVEVKTVLTELRTAERKLERWRKLQMVRGRTHIRKLSQVAMIPCSYPLIILNTGGVVFINRSRAEINRNQKKFLYKRVSFKKTGVYYCGFDGNDKGKLQDQFKKASLLKGVVAIVTDGEKFFGATIMDLPVYISDGCKYGMLE